MFKFIIIIAVITVFILCISGFSTLKMQEKLSSPFIDISPKGSDGGTFSIVVKNAAKLNPVKLNPNTVEGKAAMQNFTKVIKAIRECTKFTHREACSFLREAVTGNNVIVKNISLSKANDIKKYLENAGFEIEIKTN